MNIAIIVVLVLLLCGVFLLIGEYIGCKRERAASDKYSLKLSGIYDNYISNIKKNNQIINDAYEKQLKIITDNYKVLYQEYSKLSDKSIQGIKWTKDKIN